MANSWQMLKRTPLRMSAPLDFNSRRLSPGGSLLPLVNMVHLFEPQVHTPPLKLVFLECLLFAAQNGTIVDSTRFNTAFGKFSILDSSPPFFEMTRDMMNEYLLNMTISMMLSCGRWDTTANATRWASIKVYEFSKQLSLILPYFISMGIALPFILAGMWAPLKNGVSAMDGSFTQIITTSTGNAILDNAAAGGCLGGEESAPKELKDSKIRFGEFIGREDPGRIRRAGFGAEGEILPMKGVNYGIASWI